MSLAMNSGTYYDENNTIHPEGGRALVAYHQDCIDGFTSAWITQRALEKRGFEVICFPVTYNEAGLKRLYNNLNAHDAHVLYIVDFSVAPQVLEYINSTHPKTEVTVIDHHKSAFEMYNTIEEVNPGSTLAGFIHGAKLILDNAESGASLCERYFSDGAESLMLVQYVKDYDLWLYKLGDSTRYINKVLKKLPMTMAAWDDIAAKLQDYDEALKIYEEGRRLQATHDHKVREIANRAKPINIDGYLGLAVECPEEFKDDVGAALTAKCGGFGAMYIINTEQGFIKWSLRSKDFDIVTIAKNHGGGGHKYAAGFETALIPLVPTS